ncbi:MAG: hypothetical protein H7X86_03960 [Gorillibacterium sp.]|nr:hypothetical protein [Gorillibacterium sp.]
MAWVVLFVMAWLCCLLFVPLNVWRSLLPAGFISLITLYLIDSTLVSLNAFSYRYPTTFLGNLPILYWLSGFPGGMLLFHFFPKNKLLYFPYIVLASGIFLGMEIIMFVLNYIRYHNWSSLSSLILNIGGFTIVTSLSQWMRNVQQKYIKS